MALCSVLVWILDRDDASMSGGGTAKDSEKLVENENEHRGDSAIGCVEGDRQ